MLIKPYIFYRKFKSAVANSTLVSDAGLLILVRNCPLLQCIQFGDADLTVETLVKVLEETPTLQFLSHPKFMEALEMYYNKHGSPLRNITKLYDCAEGNINLEAIVPNICNLEVYENNAEQCLKLNSVKKMNILYDIEDFKMYALISRFGSTLTKLAVEFDVSKNAAQILNILRYCTNVKKLSISNVHHRNAFPEQSTIHESSNIIPLPALEKLTYVGKYGDNIQKPNIFESRKIVSLIVSPKLHYLEIVRLDMTDILITACKIAQQRRSLNCNLKTIKFENCLIDQKTAIQLILLAPNLESLRLENCQTNLDAILGFVRQNVVGANIHVHNEDQDHVGIKFLGDLNYVIQCQQHHN